VIGKTQQITVAGIQGSAGVERETSSCGVRWKSPMTVLYAVKRGSVAVAQAMRGASKKGAAPSGKL
jgi:hypothetical protein